MPRPPILKIVEVFASVQGEGLRQGEPTIFVRFAGCNLRCPFCDTKHAWEGGAATTAAAIAARVDGLRRRFPAAWADLTGGEPFAQEIGGLIRLLRRHGLKVQVETNGTIHRPWKVDRLTVSPKPRYYGCDPRVRRAADEVKLVVAKSLTLPVLARVRREFQPAVPILLQPESNAAWSKAKGRRLLERAARAGLPNIRLTVQLHKIYGLP
jgi:organic radical activating enzyme